VENDTEFEILAAGRRQLPKPLEIAGSDGRGRFDLNTNHISALTFHDNVHFVLILISVVGKAWTSRPANPPVSQPPRKRESQAAGQGPIDPYRIGSSVVPKIAASKSSLPEDRVRYTQLALNGPAA
jgi:hypothetical protein